MIIQNIDSAQINFDAKGVAIINIVLAVIMFGVALGITPSDFKMLLKQPKILFTGVLSQFILLPLVTFIFVSVIKPEPSIALGMFLVAACPGGNISNFITHLAKGNAALSVSLTAFATCFAVFLTPFNFHFYGNLYEPTSLILKAITLNPLDLVKVVLLILGIPLVLGMSFRQYKPKTAIKISKLLKPLSVIIFIAIVAIAFYKNIDVFLKYLKDIFVLGVSHNLIAILLGFGIAKLFGLSFKNQKTVAIETGIQNTGLGLLLIFNFFNGLGGMLIIAAFWGIWHIVSGLTLALIWSKTTEK